MMTSGRMENLTATTAWEVFFQAKGTDYTNREFYGLFWTEEDAKKRKEELEAQRTGLRYSRIHVVWIEGKWYRYFRNPVKSLKYYRGTLLYVEGKWLRVITTPLTIAGTFDQSLCGQIKVQPHQLEGDNDEHA